MHQREQRQRDHYEALARIRHLAADSVLGRAIRSTNVALDGPDITLPAAGVAITGTPRDHTSSPM